MTHYLDRVVKGIMVKPDLELTDVHGSIRDLLAAADIKYMESVRGAHSRHNNFVMVIDGDGIDRELTYNPKAQYLSGYPIVHPIVGTALFFSEAMIDLGMDIIDLSTQGESFLRHPRSGGIELGFTKWMQLNMVYTARYSIEYPPPAKD